ncbi:MAG: hypothetical protein JWQ09_206 [Segetibacter sp.]|nr:hypothetical protein [Segetibacter sp.]
MRHLLTAIVIIFLTIPCFAQDPITLKFSDWPTGVDNKTYELSSGQKLIITLTDLTSANKDDLIKNSTYDQQIGGISASGISFAALAARPGVFAFDEAGKQVIIIIDPDMLGLAKDDKIVLSLNTGNEAAKNRKLTIKKNVTTGLLASETLDPTCLYAFEKNNLKSYYDKTEIGYRHKKDRYSVHIFLDQFGNYLFGSKPTGIQRRYHYVVHVLYSAGDPSIYRFTIEPPEATLNDNSVINAAAAAAPAPKAIPDAMKIMNGGGNSCDNMIDQEFNIFPTSDNINFALMLIPKKGNSIQPVKRIQTYTLVKTPLYHGSFGAGVFGTFLANPSYQLSNITTGTGSAATTIQTVKVTDEGASINATFMYTAYFSFYNLLFPTPKLGDGSSYRYNAWGRSYLDDESNILRKIYPCFGVGLNGTVLTNWYIGFNMEPMKGFGIFVGQNLRKVTTFDMPDVSFGTTAVTQDQFNYYQNNKLKSGWALGITLDLSILSRITSGSQAQPN